MSDSRDLSVSGVIKMVGQTQQVSASFAKRELVVTTEEQYPQHILIEFAQDRCDLLDNYAVGTKVNVSINLRGREWVNPQGEAKYFNQIQGWKIARVASQPGEAAPIPAAKQNPPAATVDLGTQVDPALGF